MQRLLPAQMKFLSLLTSISDAVICYSTEVLTAIYSGRVLFRYCISAFASGDKESCLETHRA